MMKKKIILMAAALLMTLSSHAQFEAGKFYLNGSLSELNMNYNKGEKWNVSLGGRLGYLFMDNLMVLANMEYGYRNEESSFSVGPSARYYIIQNGLYIGAGVNYVHCPSSFNDLMPNLQLGYAFFVNGFMTIEPELYYNQSLNNHDYSGLGLRVGIGLYLDDVF